MKEKADQQREDLIDSKQASYRPGEIVFQRYKIVELLGKGAMGEVYKVKDTLLDKLCALKVLASGRSDPKALIRFQNEAKTVSRLRHPNIAAIFDFDVFKRSIPFMSMELVDGTSLQALLAQSWRMGLVQYCSLFEQICSALEYAHNQGIVHRDIKPANIMIVDSAAMHAKVLDFGVAKSLQATGDSADGLTVIGGFVGSPYYASPEQIENRDITPKSDMYSVGCLMFECLSGNPPFQADSMVELLQKHRTQPPPALTCSHGFDIPQALDLLVHELLEKEPANRPTATDAIAALRTISNTEFSTEYGITKDSTDLATPQHASGRSSARAGRGKRLSWRVAIILFFMVAGMAALLSLMHGELSRPKAKAKSVEISLQEALKGTQIPPLETESQGMAYEKIKNRIETRQTEFDLSKLPCTTNADMLAFEGYDGARIIRIINHLNRPLNETGLSHLAKCKNLRELSVFGAQDISLEHIADCKQLKTLRLRRLNLLDNAVYTINGFPSLAYLDVSETNFEDMLLDRLNCRALEEIDAEHIALSYGSISRFISRSPKLKCLNFGPHTAISDDTLNKLIKAFPKYKIAPDPIDTRIKRVIGLMHENNAGPARVLLEQCLAYAKDRGNRQILTSQIWKAIGDCNAITNKPQKAILAYKEAIRIAHAIGPRAETQEVSARLGLVCAFVRSRQLKEAELQTLKALNLQKGTGNVTQEVSCRTHLANVYSSQGRWKEAEQEFTWIINKIDMLHDQKLNEMVPPALVKSEMGLCERKLGKLAEAKRLFGESLNELINIARKQEQHREQIEFLLQAAAETEITLGNFNRALFINTRAMELCDKKPATRGPIVRGLLAQRLNVLSRLGKENEAKEVRARIKKLSAENSVSSGSDRKSSVAY